MMLQSVAANNTYVYVLPRVSNGEAGKTLAASFETEYTKTFLSRVTRRYNQANQDVLAEPLLEEVLSCPTPAQSFHGYLKVQKISKWIPQPVDAEPDLE